MQIVINIDDDFYKRAMVYKGEQFPNDDDLLSALIIAVNNGVPLPEGAEILTKEAYSDLCMRASKAESEGENKKEKHTCISCRFYRYDRRTWPCDDCLDYDRWKEVEE